MKRIFTAAAVLVAIVGLAGSAMAADPTGTWKSTIALNGQPLESTLRLNLDSEGPVLTGFEDVGTRDSHAPIANASYKRTKIDFSVVHEVGEQKITIRYSGTLGGDTISGMANIDYGDRNQSVNWLARRQR